MLRYLSEKSALPVPDVYHSSPALLIMQFLPGESRFDQAAEEHVAELLAQLHAISADAYGFDEDTLIGLFAQPNAWHEDWVAFFADPTSIALGRAGRADAAHAAGHARTLRSALPAAGHAD